MQQEIRFATFNVCNLALPGAVCYDNLAPLSSAGFEAKTDWIAQQIDRLDADVIGFQEIFSQAALQHALAKSKRYAHAQQVGFDPVIRGGQLTPSVALVSRLPLAGAVKTYSELPRQLSVALPGAGAISNRFTRPVLHAQVALSSELIVNVFVVHLKSQRPDYWNGEDENDPYQLGLGSLRSLIRRGTEALGLRYLLTDLLHGNRVPLVVMGDFNDVAGAITSRIVMGDGRHGKNGFDDRLFDSYRIQSGSDPLCNVGFSTLHQGQFETIDHILVSEEFNPASRFAVGEVLEVIYLNDHLQLRQPEASDHGQVLMRVKLYGADD
ncbi:endonuclease/exonuclease/phosphatase family protein [Herminiimonas sp. CN]|uniref:endonuclease/exonuclease/phosphatase family protein n=1 Tax=Herminiimonas sp. CN TaxID=1349818 RepID=UPI000473F891|nr:endonuclease/exonuclease/phosphatase family protein [Herminiimonas sp. CN]